ncbi:unnamed protein product [Moneuplotes crassus]|uniref:Uncharacterized protein n=1 Tax=Euplotes crassus TaxID=5936 RepID=A0AAD1UJE1_EUPCR|nr:unnamed protein product [Moneuplotes crassus]
MSIYSGFGTRQQEGFYNKIMLRAMEMVSDRLIAFVRGDGFEEESWYFHLRKIFKYMEVMERQKYLDPKFSNGLRKLIKVYKKHLNIPDNSTMTSRSLLLNSNKKEIEEVLADTLPENSIKEGTDEKDASQDNQKSTSGNSSKAQQDRHTDFNMNNPSMVKKSYDQKLKETHSREIKAPDDYENAFVQYNRLDNTPKVRVLNYNREAQNASSLNRRFYDQLVTPNVAFPSQMGHRKGRRVRRIRLQKNGNIYSKATKSNNREVIRSVPKHFNRKKFGQTKMNLSMIDGAPILEAEAETILAASRKSRRKYNRVRKSSKTSKYKPSFQTSSRRSNSVNSHRTKRRSSSRRRSMTKFFVKKKDNKSNSHMRPNRYLKNILPIVANEGGRGAIAQQFSSGNHI